MLGTLALSNLGRTAAREGRLDDALRMLSAALESFEEINAGSLVQEAKTRLAERAVFAGDPVEALRQADEILTSIEQAGGGSLQHALVYRIRGHALAQQGDLDAAHDAFLKSLEVARAADETYELALTLEAIGRLAAAREEDGSAESAEARGLLARLGVMSTPQVPL
jgi:tetratricopeptide (TPR) repeat protein